MPPKGVICPPARLGSVTRHHGGHRLALRRMIDIGVQSNTYGPTRSTKAAAEDDLARARKCESRQAMVDFVRQLSGSRARALPGVATTACGAMPAKPGVPQQMAASGAGAAQPKILPQQTLGEALAEAARLRDTINEQNKTINEQNETIVWFGERMASMGEKVSANVTSAKSTGKKVKGTGEKVKGTGKGKKGTKDKSAARGDLELFDVLGVGEAAIDDRGHAIRTAFGYCLCVKCGGFSRDEQGRCKLPGAQCTGRFGSRDATGRLEAAGRARLRRITRILEGRHPTEAGRKL